LLKVIANSYSRVVEFSCHLHWKYWDRCSVCIRTSVQSNLVKGHIAIGHPIFYSEPAYVPSKVPLSVEGGSGPHLRKIPWPTQVCPHQNGIFISFAVLHSSFVCSTQTIHICDMAPKLSCLCLHIFVQSRSIWVPLRRISNLSRILQAEFSLCCQSSSLKIAKGNWHRPRRSIQLFAEFASPCHRLSGTRVQLACSCHCWCVYCVDLDVSIQQSAVSTSERDIIAGLLTTASECCNSANQESSDSHSLTHRMHVFRMRLLHFVNSLHDYVMTRVMCSSTL